MLVPPHEQFLNSYTIAAPTVGFDTNYVNVVIASSVVGSVELDGLPISAGLFVPIGGSGLSGAQVPIAPGAHHLEGPHPFGVFSYGFDIDDAYGYTGGTSLGQVALATQLTLTPESATAVVGTLQSFTATVTDTAVQPLAGVRVDFAVSGPNATMGFAFTDVQGRAIFSYSGALPGTDTVNASVGTIADSSSIFWSATPPSVVFSAPDSGSEHRTGSFVLITGIAEPGIVGADIVAVMINGHSVDAFDAAGHFFAIAQIADGANSFTVIATDTLGQTGQATLQLVGVPGSTGDFDFDQAQDITSKATLAFAATTYNRDTDTLHAEARLTNDDADPLRGPVLAVFDRIAPAAVTLASAEGTDPDGKPWIAFDGQHGVDSLAPGATSQKIDVRFANTNQQRFEPFISLLAAGNLPPAFVSLPVTLAVVGQTYAYAAAADDPNNDVLTYRVTSGPSNLVINSATGQISWSPTAEQTGAFQIEIEADDGFGGLATQRFQVQVFASYPNRPPVFQSAPQTLVPAGTNYVYQPVVTDADGDTLQFFLDTAPAGMSISETTGVVEFPSAPAGNYQVTLRVEDGAGGQVTQAYVLTVGPGTPSGAPQIVSTPPVVGALGELYLYLPNVVDPLASTFVFTLPQSPAGMTIHSATGEIRWTPAAGQTGLADVTLQVDDQLGGIAVQRFVIDVTALAPNQPPVFDSTPPRYATQGIELVYLPAAHDPEAQPLSFVLDEAPCGVSFDSLSGRITWTPDSFHVGFHVFHLRTLDPAGAAALQTFYVEVRPPNFAPQFTSPPLTETTAGTVYRDQVTATDADDAFTFSLVAGPAGMFIDRRSGLLFWRSIPTDAGDHTVTVRVTDDRGAFSDRTFTLTAGVDDENPVPFVQLSEELIDLATTQSIQISIGATDNVAVVSLLLDQDGNPIPLTSGQATFTPPGPGLYTFVATATDAAGNIGTAARTLRVFDPADTTPPVISLTSPTPGAIVTYLTDVIGSVTDDNLEFYRLQVAPAGTDEWTTFFEGHDAVTAGLLGVFDPTLLQRDIYDLRVLAQDVNGQQSLFTLPCSIEAQAVLGNFTLQFTDLAIPLGGIPIRIDRVYDTLESHYEGDFGFGWRLGMQDARIRESVPVSQAERAGVPAVFGANPFKLGTRVFLTSPEGRRISFRFAPVPEPGLLGAIWHPRFLPESGVQDTLEVEDIPLSQGSDGTFHVYLAGFPYNPSDYNLRTKGGLTYEYNQFLGLKEISDRNANSVVFGEDGVVHSSGAAVDFVRDQRGRITEIVDPEGNSLLYEYDAIGDLIAATDREDARSTFTYRSLPPHYLDAFFDELGRNPVRNEFDLNNRLIATVDEDGNRLEFDYDLPGQHEVITDLRGFESVATYDELGNILSQTDALGRATSFLYDESGNELRRANALGEAYGSTYDTRGNLLTKTDPLGGVIRMTYNSFDQITSVTDPRGNVYSFEYDSRGNLTKETGPDGSFVAHDYDISGNRAHTTDQLGNSTSFEFDGRGNVTAVINALEHRTTSTFDTLGNRLSLTKVRTDSSGELHQVTTLDSYDKEGRVVLSVDAIGRATTFEWRANGDLGASVDPRGVRVEFTYDAHGNRILETYSDGTFASAVYDAASNLLERRERSGEMKTYEYDEAGQIVRSTDPSGRTSLFEYDVAGRQNAITSSGVRTVFETEPGFVFLARNLIARDDLPRITKLTRPDGYVANFEYDESGNLDSSSDSLGQAIEFTFGLDLAPASVDFGDGNSIVTQVDDKGQVIGFKDVVGVPYQYERDALGRITEVVDPLGGSTSFVYDELGNKLSQTDANGNTTHWEYDNAGHVLTRTLPLGMIETFVYNTVGDLASHTDFNGDTTTFEYDTLGRLLAKSYPGGTGVMFTYGPNGRRSSFTDSRGTTTFTYDEFRRVTRVDYPDGAFVAYVYDIQARIEQITTLSGSTAYTYDNVGRIASVTDPQGRMTSYSYDTNASTQTVTLPNGTSETTVRDELGRVIRKTNALSSGTTFAEYSVQYDPLNSRRIVTEHDGRTVTFQYDALHRLTEETIVDPIRGSQTVTYAYDAVGNRLSKTDSTGTTGYNYDANNRLSSAGGVTFSYDDNGSLILKEDGSATQIYVYDFERRLVSTISMDGAILQYRYDADGDRVSKESAGQVTTFVVDKNTTFHRVLEELDDAGDIVFHYTYGAELISQDGGGSNVRFYHRDAAGSVRMLTDSGAVVTDEYLYDAFGNLLFQTGNSSNTFQFAGEQFDDETGLYYLRARYLDPVTARFITQDAFQGTTEDPASLNAYVYANSDPTTFRDPSGNMALGEYAGVVKKTVDLALSKWGFGAAAAAGFGALATAVSLGIQQQFVPTHLLFAGSFFLGVKKDIGSIGYSRSSETLIANGRGAPGQLGYTSNGFAFQLSYPQAASLEFSGSFSITVGEVFNVFAPGDYEGYFSEGAFSYGFVVITDIATTLTRKGSFSISAGAVLDAPSASIFSVTWAQRWYTLA
jgi:RHS repeat-associated protein